MAFLIVTEPQAYILVVITKIVSTLAMLLIKQPLAFIFLTVGEGVDTITITFALDKLTLISISVFIKDTAFALGLPRSHLTLIGSFYTLFHNGART